MNHSRRDFLNVTGLTAIGLALHHHAIGHILPDDDELTLYVGTYTSGSARAGEGIYIYRMNEKTAELSHFKTITGVADPSFLALDPKRRHLYSVNEVEQFESKPSGSVSAFSVDKKTGDLSFLNRQSTSGAAPCHLIVDEKGKHVLVANYTGGSVSVLPITDAGSLGMTTSLMQHKGSSVNKDRQTAPHAHCIVLDKSNDYALAVDLGLDKVLIYKFDAKTGKLVANDVPFVNVNPGDGPRHIAFHPDGKFAYVINELSNTIVAFRFDKGTGSLKHLQTFSTLPVGFTGKSWTAEVVISPSGKFLYGSNRGHDSIVSFAIDQKTGMLSLIEHVPTQGKHPRHFTIDPNEKFLLVANRDSDSIVSFHISEDTGRLEPTGHVTKVPRPVCLLF
jgi:6-phosphogluconolactonase